MWVSLTDFERIRNEIFLAICGDSLKGVLETCDDGNSISGDGCSSSCTVETGYVCSGTGPRSCFGDFSLHFGQM